MDQFSRWHLQELVTAVGAAGVALIEEAFPGQEAEKRAGDGAALDGTRARLSSWRFERSRSKRRVQANRRQRETEGMF
jgi:hypothetical protein